MIRVHISVMIYSCDSCVQELRDGMRLRVDKAISAQVLALVSSFCIQTICFIVHDLLLHRPHFAENHFQYLSDAPFSHLPFRTVLLDLLLVCCILLKSFCIESSILIFYFTSASFWNSPLNHLFGSSILLSRPFAIFFAACKDQGLPEAYG